MAEILAEDSGIIRCICEFDHDDNFTIQCERCNAWQHAKCVDITDEKAVPDNYLCPDCSQQRVKPDKERARGHQLQFLQQKTELIKQKSRNKNNDEQLEAERQDDRRRRGSRKRSLGKDSAERSPEVESFPLFDISKFGIPKETSTWTADAAFVWSELVNADTNSVPLLGSPQEIRNLAPVHVVRRSSVEDNWAFGPSAGKVLASTSIVSNRPICEIVGEIMLRTEYISQAINQFEKLGCPKQGVLFVPGTPLAIDARRKGSQSILFLGRSSRPNARVATRRDSKGRLRVLLYARRPIKAGSEISLGWHWPKDHPVRQFNSSEELHKGTQPVFSPENHKEISSYNPVDPKSALASAKVVVTAIMWLLNTTLEACLPTEQDEEEDEDWDVPADSKISRAVTAPPRKVTRAEMLKLESTMLEPGVLADPKMAPSTQVWVPTTQDIAPPLKKRMSLKDYMRKRI